MATEDSDQITPKSTSPKPQDATAKVAAKKKATAAKNKNAAAAKAVPKPAPDQKPVVQPSVGTIAKAARLRRRHWNAIFSFLVLVIAPVALSGWYLWERAVEQYSSTVSFSVRSSSPPAAGSELFSQISLISGTLQ